MWDEDEVSILLAFIQILTLHSNQSGKSKIGSSYHTFEAESLEMTLPFNIFEA